MRFPQCAQNGRDGSAGFPQRLHTAFDVAGGLDTRVAGTLAEFGGSAGRV
jgi:hypothetical protein